MFLFRMFDVNKSKNRSPDRTFWKKRIGVEPDREESPTSPIFTSNVTVIHA